MEFKPVTGFAVKSPIASADAPPSAADPAGEDSSPARRKPGRPATGQTPKRYFRADQRTWLLIVRAADRLGITASQFIRDALLAKARRVLKNPRKNGD